VLCGVRKGGETVVPFPAEQIPDLVEGDGLLPNEVPCGRLASTTRLSRQHCRRHGMEMFRALRVTRRSAIKINAFETNHSSKPLPRGTYRKRSFSGSERCMLVEAVGRGSGKFVSNEQPLNTAAINRQRNLRILLT
jgi:hypothetical protein